MTALCGGGSSGPLPLTQPIINMTAVGAEALATVFGVPELGIPLSLAAGALDIISAQYCSSDPPPDPGLVQQDVFDAMNLAVPSVSIPAQLRVQQWFLHRYWWQICQCTGGTTPAPPVMSNPGTPVGIGTGAPSGLGPGPCWTGSGKMHFIESQTAIGDSTGPWLPSGPESLVTLPQVLVPVCRLPPTMTGFAWDVQLVSSNAPSLVFFEPTSTNGTGENIGSFLDSTQPSTWKGSSPWEPTPAQPYAILGSTLNPNNPNASLSAIWNGTFTITCSDSPPGSIVQPCCPPDPLIEVKLDRLLGLVLDLYNRSSGPVAGYVKGATHTGLTGSGNIPVSGRNGVLVHVTTVPPTFQQGGNPPYIWDLGWLSCSSPDGFVDEKRLTRQTQIWLSGLFPVSSSFGYFLQPGVVADVTELLPA